MAWRDLGRAIVLALALLVAIKTVQELYGWFAYADERTRLRALAGELEVVGVRVVRTQLHADSLQGAIEAMDRELEGVRRDVVEVEEQAMEGAIPRRIYPTYLRRLEVYNGLVRRRNRLLAEWRGLLSEHRAATARFNLVADSMRALATAMGEPYYQVPSPVEVAVRNGLRPPAARPRPPR